MARSDVQTNIRLEADLKQWLQDRAKANRRSLNGELVVCLEQIQRQQQKEQASGNGQTQ